MSAWYWVRRQRHAGSTCISFVGCRGQPEGDGGEQDAGQLLRLGPGNRAILWARYSSEAYIGWRM